MKKLLIAGLMATLACGIANAKTYNDESVATLTGNLYLDSESYEGEIGYDGKPFPPAIILKLKQPISVLSQPSDDYPAEKITEKEVQLFGNGNGKYKGNLPKKGCITVTGKLFVPMAGKSYIRPFAMFVDSYKKCN